MIPTEIMGFSCFTARVYFIYVCTSSFYCYLLEFLNIVHVGSDIQKYGAISGSTEIRSYEF